VHLSACVFVCLSVHEHISGPAGPIFTKFCVQISCGRGSVLLWQRCAKLCTSGFMDDVTFGCNGPYAETWRLHRAATAMSGVAILGRSLMSMNACLLLFLLPGSLNLLPLDVPVRWSCIVTVDETVSRS